MSNLFAKLQQQAQQVKTVDEDRASKYTVDSNAYATKVRVAYLDAYASGAMFVAIDALVKVDGKDRQYKENINISNKAGGLTYTDKDGAAQPLPGYALIDTFCKAATGKTFAEMTTETKQIKVRNPKTKVDEPQPKEVFMDLVNAELVLGILEVEEDHWDTTKVGEVVNRNKIDKIFTADGFTLNEKIAGCAPAYLSSWTEQNKGKKRMNAKNKGAATVGAPATAGAPTTAKSLF